MIQRDLLGLELDDVLEGYECDFVVEPRDVLLDPGVRMRLDEADVYQLSADQRERIGACRSLGEAWSVGLDISAENEDA